MKKALLILIVFSIFSAGDASAQDFTLGGDISWYTEMVKQSQYQFVCRDGSVSTCTAQMASYGLTAVRLRAWVDPSAGYNNKVDVVTKAKAAKSRGMDVMIDFHMSDGWADPGQQTIPVAWQDHDATQMAEDIRVHVTDVLTALKDAGVTPRWVQIGNETNDGMLWDTGRLSTHPDNFCAFINAGYEAVKAVCTNAKVIVHISNGYDQSLFDWVFGILKKNKVKYDMIGMSLYPHYKENMTEAIDQTMANIKHLYTTFGKYTMICEVGLPVGADDSPKYMADILSKAYGSTNGYCKGIFYWEPECPSQWAGYKLGAATLTGKKVKLTAVMDEWWEFSTKLPTEISQVRSLETGVSNDSYSLSGTPRLPGAPGVSILNGKKVLVK